MARNVDTTQILAKMKVIPQLSKENVAIVNKEYFDEFEKNLEATHECGRFGIILRAKQKILTRFMLLTK